MKLISAPAIALLTFFPHLAQGQAVYDGCASPALKAGHHTFYVDPVKGSLAGDGTASKPWKTFADVVNPANALIATQGHAGWSYDNGRDTSLHPVNPTAPIKPGDLILLYSGDHGSPSIVNMDNADFITVAAAPGQTPLLHTMAIISSAKWVFQGLKFQALESTATGATKAIQSGAGMVTAGRGDWEGPTSDIVFSGNSFSAADATTGWSDYDWINKPYGEALWSTAPCTSVVGNHLYNLFNGLTISGQTSLVQGNLIEAFSNDGLDITTSNLLVKGNTITGGVNTLADPLHADGIQGWSAIVNNLPVPNTNVVIDGNTVIKAATPGNTYMQGISIFDGIWSGLKIQNNVVAVAHWNAISVFGASNSTIINNTVLASDPVGRPSWIEINPRKDGTHSSNVTVRNNISQTLAINDTGVTLDHNIAVTSITAPVNGKSTVITSGTIGTQNTVIPSILAGFNTVNNATATYDLRLRSTSAAIGFGSPTLAPPLDILGKTRVAPIDNGAYVH